MEEKQEIIWPPKETSIPIAWHISVYRNQILTIVTVEETPFI